MIKRPPPDKRQRHDEECVGFAATQQLVVKTQHRRAKNRQQLADTRLELAKERQLHHRGCNQSSEKHRQHLATRKLFLCMTKAELERLPRGRRFAMVWPGQQPQREAAAGQLHSVKKLAEEPLFDIVLLQRPDRESLLERACAAPAKQQAASPEPKAKMRGALRFSSSPRYVLLSCGRSVGCREFPSLADGLLLLEEEASALRSQAHKPYKGAEA